MHAFGTVQVQSYATSTNALAINAYSGQSGFCHEFDDGPSPQNAEDTALCRDQDTVA